MKQHKYIFDDVKHTRVIERVGMSVGGGQDRTLKPSFREQIVSLLAEYYLI